MEPNASRFNVFSAFAPAGYAVGLHMGFNAARVAATTYPEAWIDAYTADGMALDDPVMLWAFANFGTIRWSALANDDPKQVLCRARAWGLNFGAVVSCGTPKVRSIAGFSRSDREFTDTELSDMQHLFQGLHDDLSPDDALSEMQIEALRLIAQGHRYAVAAEIAGISQSALNARLKSVRTKLGCKTTAAAIQRAAQLRLL